MSAYLQKLNEKYVSRTPHMRAIGATVTAVDKGRGTMKLPARPDWLGDPVRGVLHPGALTVLADSACGLAVGAALDTPVPYATLDLRMDYLRPAVPERDVFCEAECFRLSRNVAFVRAEVWQDDRADPTAAAQGTFMLSTAPGTRPPAPGAVAAPQERPVENAAAALPPWSAPEGSAPIALERPVPYVEFLGIRSSPTEQGTLYRMPYQEKLIGNPRLPALHGGVVAGFGETAALLSLIERLKGEKFPKSIDFSIDYLRSGRPEETFADCEIVRIGARVALVQVRCWQKNPGYPIAVMRGHFLLTERDAI
ncbi:MAG: hotdog fold thioesterase [Burkholderiaceae bacterium]|nr:MAG: hotdog fold thioesterase [Burkholderiaceae bacterium]